jgi:hypothetical protein
MNLERVVRRAFLPVAAVLLLSASGAARADVLTYTDVNILNKETVNIIAGAPGGDASAGEIQLKVGTSTLVAWCLDLFNNLGGISPGNPLPITLTISDLATAGSAGGNNPSLNTTQIGQIGALMANAGSVIGGPNPDASAAIQVAIWNIEYGSTFAFTAPFNLGLPGLESTYVANVGGIGGNGPIVWAPVTPVTLLSDFPYNTQDGNQSLGFVTPIPVPGTLPLIITGLGLLGAVTSRRKRKQSSSLSI